MSIYCTVFFYLMISPCIFGTIGLLDINIPKILAVRNNSDYPGKAYRKDT